MKHSHAAPLIWANLIHLGYNMWEDRPDPRIHRRYPARLAQPYVRFDEKLWDDLLVRMTAAGVNMVILDLGEAVRYESHPELAARGAWSHAKLRRELARMRKLGIEVIPKMNFSSTHDAWLGVYGRQVSTDTYYAVCRELIAEAIELFDTPRFFHLGMDEETAVEQEFQSHAVLRQHDLWWHDLRFLVDQVERRNVRAWVWSDYMWFHEEDYLRKMPRSVLQSNWYYGPDVTSRWFKVKAFLTLEKHGYDQVPAGSNWLHAENMPRLVRYLGGRIGPERLKGFMQTPWQPTIPAYRRHHIQAIDQLARAKRVWDG